MQFLGTSAGSIVAALYGMGYSPEEMIKLFNYFSKSVMGISPKYMFTGIKEVRGVKLGGLISSQNIELAIQETAKYKNITKIEDIKMPLSIPTTDLITNKKLVFTNNKNLQTEEYMHNIEIGKAVRASSTFPGMYAPFEYKKYQFVDGGIFDNLPVDEAKKLGVDKVIAIKFKLKNFKKQNTIYNIAMKSLDLMTERLVEESVKNSDCLVEIDLKDVKPFNIGKIEFCYKEGYNQTTDNMLKIKRALEK